MLCLICRRAELVEDLTSVLFERGEAKITIKHAPAWICPECGDAVVSEDVATRLLSAAELLLAAGLIEGTEDFRAS